MAKTIWQKSGLAVDPVVITPSDVGTHEFEILYIGVAGDLEFTPAGYPHSAKIVMAVQADWFPTPVSRVWAANTTATDIVGFQQG